MTTSDSPIPRWQIITGHVLSVLPGLALVPSSFFKLAQPGPFLENWTKNYPAGAARPLGAIELLAYVLYLVPKTRPLGGLVLLAYLGGAVATHVHMDDGKWFVPVIVGVLLWGALWLRDPRVRALVPLASDAERARTSAAQPQG
jgi:hypothetical protein